jgi:hypothetical protein
VFFIYLFFLHKFQKQNAWRQEKQKNGLASRKTKKTAWRQEKQKNAWRQEKQETETKRIGAKKTQTTHTTKHITYSCHLLGRQWRVKKG